MRERKTRVYVAGKLNDDAVGYLHNVHLMMETAEAARLAGFSVFIPAIDLLCGIKHGYSTYQEYFDNGQPWLMASDAVLLVPGWETSKGTAAEIATAEEYGIPVFKELSELIEAELDGLRRWFMDEIKMVDVTDDEAMEEVRDILKEGMKDAV